MSPTDDHDDELTEKGPQKPLTRTVLRGVGISGLGYLGTQILTLGVFLVLARLATPTDFGELAAGSILVSVGILFTESGMSSALIHRPDRVDEAAATATVSTFTAGVVLSLVALALSPVVGIVFDSDTVAKVAAATSGLLLLRTIPLVPTALLQRKFSFVRRVIVEPLGVVVFAVTAIIATANDMGVWGLVLGYYAQAVSDVILSWWLAHWRPKLRLASFSMWRELIAYGRHVFVASAVIRGANELPVLLIGRYVGTAPLGQYRYASRLATTPLAAMLAAASYVLFPAFARIADDPARFRHAFVRSLRWVSLLGIPIGLILIPLGEPLATLVFGRQWEEAGRAAAALALFPAAGALGSVVAESFQALGRPQLLTKMHAIEAVIGGGAMLALLPFDLIGICIGVSIGVLAGACYALLRIRSLIGISGREIGAEILPPILAALAMVVALVPLEHLVLNAADRSVAVGLGLVTLELAAGGLVYLLALRVLVPSRGAELLGLIKHLRGRRPSGPPDEESLDAGSDPVL